MDDLQFDALTRAFRQPGSRRGAIGALALAAFSPLSAAARPKPAKCLPSGKRCTLAEAPQAERHGKGNGKRKGKHHPPVCSKCCSRYGSARPDGKARCSCKPDGTSCDNASQCCGGMCRDEQCTGCPGDLTACAGACVDLQTNNQHCGECDVACDAGQRCLAGSCVCDGQSCPTGCCAGTSCKRGTSPTACGNDGGTCHSCENGETCPDGTCICPSSVICSSGGCCASADQVCDQNEQCCTLKTCADYPGVCGTTLDDGCGGVLACDCPSGQACLGNGTCILHCTSADPCPSDCAAECRGTPVGGICAKNRTSVGCFFEEPDSCPQGMFCDFRDSVCYTPCVA